VASSGQLHRTVAIGETGHKLESVAIRFGSRDAAYDAIESVAQQVVTKKGLNGVFSEVVDVGGTNVTVEGKVINGVARVGTAYVR
jgi:hypothetical protein